MRYRAAIFCLLFAFCALALPVIAQDEPGLEQGLKPFGTYEGNDIDSVSMTSGNLNVHIPLLSYPQRGGKLTLSFLLRYNRVQFNTATHCNNTPPLDCELIVSPAVGPNSPATGPSGIYPDEAQRFDQMYTAQTRGCYPTFPPVCFMGDGASHWLGKVPNGWETIDATGLSYNPSTSTLTDRDGIRYTPSSPFLTGSYSKEDANGNEISFSPTSGWTDSLGRLIPLVPHDSNFNMNSIAGGTTTDTSGCVGPLPIIAAYLWTPPGPAGSGATQFKFCYVTVNVVTHFTSSDSDEGLNFTGLQSIVLYNGISWTTSPAWEFEYNSPEPGYPGTNYGDLTKITFPAGGSISYTWGTYSEPPNSYTRIVLSHSTNANDGSPVRTWTYNWVLPGATTVTGPPVTGTVGDDTVFTVSEFGSGIFYVTQIDYYQGSHSGGVLLKTVKTTYASRTANVYCSSGNLTFGFVPATQTTIWPNGQQSEVTYQYDSSLNFTNPMTNAPITGTYGAVLNKSEYDLGNGTPGPLLRSTTDTYQAFSNSSYLTNNLLNLETSETMASGSGTTLSYATYAYDETTPNSSGISTMHQESPPWGNVRGNLTSVHQELLNGAAVSTTNCPVSISPGGYLVTTNVYFDTGTVNTSKDPCTHTTTYGYSSTYAGAYPTSVTNTLTQTTSYSYDFGTGRLTSKTDPNNQTTSYTYDNLWRLASIGYPDGGLDTITRQEQTFPFSVTLTEKITSSLNKVSTDVFDGIGRVTEHQLLAPCGTIKTDFTYDALGRKATASNPYCSTSDPTYGITSYQYDALGRPTLMIPSDGTPSSDNVSTTYCGGSSLLTDEAGKWRRTTYDGLGRMVEVDEPNSLTATVNSDGCPGSNDPIWATTYTYDALNDLLGVVQSGSRNRSFIYDSLRRLTSATNPETGATAVAYSYDADANVITKTDGRAIPINYLYDALNRPTGRTYSNGDPAVTYSYDQVQTGYYNIGRRTGMTDAGGSESFDYDQLGRMQTDQRTTNSVMKTSTYTYNFDGSLATLTYPSGREITYTYNAAAQPISAVDIANSVTYATNASYAPQGVLAQIQSGTNLVTTYIYNQRLQPCWFFATTGSPLPLQGTTCNSTASPAGNILDLKYNYNLTVADNGNVIGIANNRDSTRTESFAYDQVNRISSAQTSSTSGGNCWGESYTIDQWSNLTGIGAVSGYGGCTQEGLSVGVTANNQLYATGFSYDDSGNMVRDARNSYVWNSESEIKSAAGITYVYDGDGNRLAKSSGKTYWYGLGGEVLDESNSTGSITDEYVYFDDKRIAHRDASGNIYYYAEDKLVSARTLVLAGQTSPCYDADFYPYGGERDITTNCTQAYKFEGKERDAESGNDDFGARYYESTLGRWLSADWSNDPSPIPFADLTDPQTLNLYAIVGDAPESFTEVDGHCSDRDGAGDGGCDEGAVTTTSETYQTIAPQSQAQNGNQSPVHAIGWWRRLLDAFSQGYGPRNSSEGTAPTQIYGGGPSSATSASRSGAPTLSRAAIGGVALAGGAELAGDVGGGAACALVEPCGVVAGVALVGAGSVLLYENFKRGGGNQAANRAFGEAVRQIERALGRKLTQDEVQRLHREISKQNYSLEEIVQIGVAMFSH